jgi:hypothetical protein
MHIEGYRRYVRPSCCDMLRFQTRAPSLCVARPRVQTAPSRAPTAYRSSVRILELPITAEKVYFALRAKPQHGFPVPRQQLDQCASC